MQLRRLALMVALLAGPAAAQDHPQFFITAEREAIWAQMKADYDASPGNPNTLGGKIYKRVFDVVACAGTCESSDRGEYGAWLYHVTGNAAYAAQSYDRIEAVFLSKDSSNCNVMAKTHSSNEFVALNWVYDWTYPALSAGERTAFLDKLNDVATCLHGASSPLGGSFRPADMDQIIGDYFGTAMLYASTGAYNSTIVTHFEDSSKKFGGYIATGADETTRRNAIKLYATVYDVGGEMSQSSEYNLRSTQTVTMGAEAMFTILGIDRFPEITAWREDAALQWIHNSMPGFTAGGGQVYQWGDEERPRNIYGQYRLETAFTLAGLTEGDAIGPFIQDWAMDWIEGTTLAAVDIFPRFLPIFNPYAARNDYTSLSSKTKYSSGRQLLHSRTGWTVSDSALSIQFNQFRSVDHRTCFFGEWQWWKNGFWAMTHPISYNGPSISSVGTNNISLGGASAGGATYNEQCFPEYRGTPTYKDDIATNGYLYARATMGGSLFRENYFNMPDTYLNEHSRAFVWLPSLDVVVIHDRTNATDPQTTGQGLTGYPSALATWVAARPANKEYWFHMPVSPTLSAGRTDWTYSGSNSIRVTHLLPTSINRSIENETTLWVAGSYLGVGTIQASEKKYHVQLTPTSENKWDTFLNCFNAHSGTPATCVLVQDTTNDVDAAFVTLGSTNYLTAFNAVQGADVPNRVKINGRGFYVAGGAAAVLDEVTLRSTGFTLVFTAAGGSTTKAILTDLDPSVVWQYTLNGGGAQSLSVSAEGIGVVSTALTGAVTLVVSPTGAVPVTIITGTLPNGIVGTACAGTLEASGGNGGPYTWSATVGTVPSGCTLNANGTWSGNYTTAQSKTFTLQACESTPLCGSREFSLVVVATPVITTTVLDNGTVGEAYSDSCATSGGTAPLTYTVDPSPLCPGLSINASTCAITGTPTTVGTCEFTITVTDNVALTDDAELTIDIAQASPEVVDVWIAQQGFRAIVHYGLRGLPYDSSCTVDLYDPTSPAPPLDPIDSETQATGLATRYAIFTNLDPDILYSAYIQCSITAVSGPHQFTMPSRPTSGAITVPIDIPAAPAILPTAARVTIEWDYDGQMVAPDTVTDTNCASGCRIDVTFPAQNIYFYRLKWKNSGGTTLATSPPQPLVVK